MIGEMLAQYRIEAHLGTGGMGIVYRAYDTRLRRVAALKLLGGSAPALALDGDRLLHEARSASALNHPNACTIYEIGETGGRRYIAMEYVEGRSLGDTVRSLGALAVEGVARYGAQVADALAHAHARGVIHRDLKSANVMLTADDRVKVLDFGLALRLPERARATSFDSTAPLGLRDGLVGTLAYMAPELLCGAVATVQSDLWSLGVLLYELATGELPFRGVTAFDLSAAILREPPAAFPAPVPAALRAIVLRCLAKDPARRYRNAGEVRTALQTLRSGVVSGVVSGGLPLPLAVAAGGRRSVLVLPFANLSPDREGDYFSDGLTDEIIADLSAVRALRIISRTSSMRLKGTQRSMREIAAEVDVEYVLEGTVRRHGGALRVTAQLVDAAVDSPVWAHKYTGAFDDVFAIQETLARTIVEALALELSAEEERKMTARPIDNPEAYDTYLRARQQLHRYSREGLEQALAHLQQGIAKVGENVLMLSAMGQVHWQYVNAGLSADTSHLDQAADYARRILALEPESPHGHRLLGLVSVHRGDMPSAVRWLRWAVAGDPADVETHMWLALTYTVVGRPEQAAPLVAKVLEMDPLTPLYRALPAAVDVAAGRFREAADSLAPHVEANADNSFVRMFHGLILAMSGEADQAVEVFAALERDLPGVPFTQLGSAFGHALRGQREQALAAVGDEARQAFRSDPQYAHYMAQCCALAGEVSEALDWTEQAVQRGFANYPLLQTFDPFMSSLRAEPRFRVLLDEVQRRWKSFEV